MKKYVPSSPINWSKMSPNEVAAALRNIPRRVAYAWRLTSKGDWVRDDADEYGVAMAASVYKNDDGTWRGPPIQTIKKDPRGSESWDTLPSHPYATAEAAKLDYDLWLKRNGWLIDDTDDGSCGGPQIDNWKVIVVDGQTIQVTQYSWDDGTRVWFEIRAGS